MYFLDLIPPNYWACAAARASASMLSSPKNVLAALSGGGDRLFSHSRMKSAVVCLMLLGNSRSSINCGSSSSLLPLALLPFPLASTLAAGVGDCEAERSSLRERLRLLCFSGWLEFSTGTIQEAIKQKPAKGDVGCGRAAIRGSQGVLSCA